MSRYIEQEYIGRTINHLPTQYISQECENNKTEVEIMVSIIAVNQVIKEAPSIDLVFCKECIHKRYDVKDDIYQCKKTFHRFYNTDHYCSYGEREENKR